MVVQFKFPKIDHFNHYHSGLVEIFSGRKGLTVFDDTEYGNEIKQVIKKGKIYYGFVSYDGHFLIWEHAKS